MWNLPIQVLADVPVVLKLRHKYNANFRIINTSSSAAVLSLRRKKVRGLEDEWKLKGEIFEQSQPA